MTDQLSFAGKLAHNIGLIVLESQELERHMKLLAAWIDPSTHKPFLDRHKRLERRSLGEVVKQFLSNGTVTQGSIDDLEGFFRSLLDRRNKVVHHFFETYREELASANHSQILSNLGELFTELRDVTKSFRDVNQAIYEDLLQEESVSS